jgi:hypothetical protein
MLMIMAAVLLVASSAGWRFYRAKAQCSEMSDETIKLRAHHTWMAMQPMADIPSKSDAKHQ